MEEEGEGIPMPLDELIGTTPFKPDGSPKKGKSTLSTQQRLKEFLQMPTRQFMAKLGIYLAEDAEQSASW
jgi:hypothetical protein